MSLPPEALSRRELESRLRRSRALNLILGVVAVVAVVFGAVQWTQVSASNGHSAEVQIEESADEATDETVSIERRIEGDPMAIGSLDAPVVLSEWIDFRCPYCAVFSRDTFPRIVQEYVDAGDVRIEVHDVAFFGDESERAAVAARAAGEQGMYFEFLEAVYAAAPESGHPELSEQELIGFATQVGVPDIPRFTEDLASDALRAAVRESTANAQQLGVSAVPFFAVRGQALSGAQPIENFRQFLDQHL